VPLQSILCFKSTARCVVARGIDGSLFCCCCCCLHPVHFGFEVSQGSCRNVQCSGLSDLAHLAPNLQHFSCKSLQIDLQTRKRQLAAHQDQQDHHSLQQHQQQSVLSAGTAVTAPAQTAPAQTTASCGKVAAGVVAASACPPVLPNVTHFGCGAMYLPAGSAAEAAARFAGTFPSLQVLTETPYTISRAARPDTAADSDSTHAVPLGLLLRQLPGLRAVRVNTFENLARLDSLQGLRPAAAAAAACPAHLCSLIL